MRKYNLAVADINVSGAKCYTCKKEFECQSMIRLVLDAPTAEPVQTNQFELCPECASFLNTCITTAMVNIITWRIK